MATSFRPSRRGVSYSQALTAAYASVTEDEVILDTLEFRHPAFVDGNGDPMAVRVVNDHTSLLAYLEADAPMNPGEEVTYSPVAFRFSRPDESNSDKMPEIQIQVDNAARVLIPYLDLAVTGKDLIYVTWRQYLASDLSTPHMLPPLTMTLKQVSADMNVVTATAGFADLSNRRFPTLEYTRSKFKSLAAR